MGILAGLGQSLAGAFGGTATANATAASSLGWGTIATGLGTVGNLVSGIGGYQEANYAASVKLQDAQAALQAGQQEESASKMKYGNLASQQVANAAGNGIDVGSGAVQNTVNSTREISSMDASLIHFNAARQAYGDQVQAGLDKAAGRGALLKGVFGATTSFLSGTSSLSDKLLGYQMSGVGGIKVPGTPSSPTSVSQFPGLPGISSFIPGMPNG